MAEVPGSNPAFPKINDVHLTLREDQAMKGKVLLRLAIRNRETTNQFFTAYTVIFFVKLSNKIVPITTKKK